MSNEESEKRFAAIHGVLLLALFVVTTLILPSVPWPWYLLVPVLLYGGLVLAIAPLRQSFPACAVGRIDGKPLVFAIVLTASTTAVLVTFHTLMQPDVSTFAGRLPIDWFGNLIVAAVCISVLNALLEELIFRGVLWEAVAAEWNPGIALGVTALAFGIGHLDGYPPGPLGAVMAGVYGIALGGLRWWAGGLGLTVLCHVGADATIFVIVIESRQ